MKKLIVAVALAIIIAIAVVPQVANAETVTDTTAQNTQAYQFVEQMCAIRSGEGTAEEKKAAIVKFIEDKFAEALNGHGTVDEQPFTYDDKDYINIVAQIVKEGTDKQIIIGAHYDVLIGEGANDNSCGVASLYLTIKELALQADKLPFSVVFVAFDCEEAGMLGSHYYVQKMTNADVDNTLLMFNIDVIATGDNLYFFAENKRTDIANLILDNSAGIIEKPHAKGIYLLDLFGYGYYEQVQGSDHTPFRLLGIPTVMFFSGTYTLGSWGYAESSDEAKSNMNSADDTFDNLVNNTQDFTARIDTVTNAIVNAVLNDSFVQVAENARNQLVNFTVWYNRLWPSLTVIGLLIILTVFAVLYYRKLQKKAILGTADVKTNKVFDKPDAEDIFTFKGQSGKSDNGNSADVEDIFTFKK